LTARNATPPRADHLSDHRVPRGERDFALTFPPELIEAIAERTAELLAARLPESSEGYLDVDGAAEYLSCKPHRIYDLCRQGLPVYKDGSRSLFKGCDLDAWLTKA
jgi:excisionase family DNA binding protein